MQLFRRDHPIPALHALVSGVFDVDRGDYLLRDSFFTGVEYGKYDLAWLIHSMSLTSGQHRRPMLILDGPRGIDAFRQFVQARRSMYRQVYYHQTIRSAQKLLRAVFERAQDVPASVEGLDIPAPLRGVVAEKKKATLDDFMATNDFTIMNAVSAFRDSRDEVLSGLAMSFLRRKLPKSIYDSTRVHCDRHFFQDQSRVDEVVSRLRSRLKNTVGSAVPGGQDAIDYSVLYDLVRLPSDRLDDIYFQIAGESYTLDKLSEWGADFNLRELAREVDIFRIYVPEEARSEAVAFLREELAA